MDDFKYEVVVTRLIELIKFAFYTSVVMVVAKLEENSIICNNN